MSGFSISEAKKQEFWDALSTERQRPPVLTDKRMAKLKLLVWNDWNFWDDIVARHGGMNSTPAQIKENAPDVFEHCLSNFHGMLVQARALAAKPATQ